MKKIYLVSVLIVVFLTGCINLKDDYPEISYYQLSELPTNISDVKQISGALHIRNFTISSEYDTKHLLANWDGLRVQKYYYHRWISDISEMTTDYIFKRIAQLKWFSEGPIRSTSIIVPDYILEGQILNLSVNNTENPEKGKNDVEIEIKINLIIKNQDKPGEKTIFSELYKETVIRQNNFASSIAPAYSRGISLISDKISVDISNAITKYQLGL